VIGERSKPVKEVIIGLRPPARLPLGEIVLQVPLHSTFHELKKSPEVLEVSLEVDYPFDQDEGRLFGRFLARFVGHAASW
jgi:hypothetical protein